jgi:hypothetical protein
MDARPEPQEDPWDTIRTMALEVRALVHDEASGELIYNEDPEADRELYALAFQSWAAGKLPGPPQLIFATVTEVLEL